jgi:hypothetical protein
LTDHSWQRNHWNIIKQNYSKAKHFNDYKLFFEQIYLSKQWTSLSELNQHIIKQISIDLLGIQTEFDDSRNYNLQLKNSERVLEILQKTGATAYLSGPSAKAYLQSEEFDRTGIQLEWMDYKDYPEYSQLHPPFDHNVSIIDLIFNEGNKATSYLKSSQQGKMTQ